MMDSFTLPRVSITGLEGNAPVKIESTLRRLLDGLGGLENYVSPGQKVLLKPDLMSDYPGGAGPTTDPELVAAVGRLAAECGAEVTIGDSPFVLRGRREDFYQKAGMTAIARRDGLRLANFEMAGSRAVALDTKVYYVSRAVLEADVVINIPTLKPDRWTGFAGAIRNMIGIIPGFQKGNYFKSAGGTRDIARFMVDLLSLVRPALTIFDMPTYQMSGQGGSHSRRFLAASPDAVAIDTVTSEILEIESERLHTTRLAADAGLGIGWMEAIFFEGLTIESLKPFFSPSPDCTRSSFIGTIARGLMQPYIWMRSTVSKELCRGCRLCVDACPTRALRFDDATKTPTINDALCIHCWAGLANCPHSAITASESRLVAKMFTG